MRRKRCVLFFNFARFYVLRVFYKQFNKIILKKKIQLLLQPLSTLTVAPAFYAGMSIVTYSRYLSQKSRRSSNSCLAIFESICAILTTYPNSKFFSLRSLMSRRCGFFVCCEIGINIQYLCVLVYVCVSVGASEYICVIWKVRRGRNGWVTCKWQGDFQRIQYENGS